MNKKKLYWTLQLGGWSFYSFIQILGGILISNQGIRLSQISFLIAEAILFLLLTHFFRYCIIRWGWLNIGMARLIPRLLVGAFVLGMFIYVFRNSVSYPLGMFDASVVFNLANFFGLTATYALIVFIWSVFYFTYHYFESYNKSLKYDAAINEIELNNLKSQLNPHFIFNALNSIRALVDENPNKSKNAITQLSNILRNALVTNKRRLTDFGGEINMVKDYLSLESIRYEERLQTEFNIHPLSYKFLVPPLMLQTLVENCIKHGIAKLKNGGMVKLNTSVEDSKLKIQIRNTGHIKFVNGIKKPDGLGIKNTLQRLKLLYGDAASFRISNEEHNVVLTELTIPQHLEQQHLES